jgi:hypothetical protein
MRGSGEGSRGVRHSGELGVVEGSGSSTCNTSPTHVIQGRKYVEDYCNVIKSEVLPDKNYTY